MGSAKFVRLSIFSFLSGIVFISVFADLSWNWVLFIGVTLIVICVVWRRFLWVVFIVCFLTGVFRLLVSLPMLGVGDIAYYVGMSEKVTVEGQICAEVDVRSDKQYFLLCSSEFNVNGSKILVSGKVLVKARKYPVYNYGDRVICNGQLNQPISFIGFNYQAYLAKDDIYAVMYDPFITRKEGSLIGGGLGPFFVLKSYIRKKVEHLFTEPSASLVLGLLLGVRTSIPENVLEDFQKTGLTHILAISGYNITLIITIFALFMRNAGRKLRFVFTVSGIVVFAILTGMSASVIRASVMGVITVLALFVGRKSNGTHALLLSIFFMVFVNPKILMQDISFQLSFMSTLGLLVLLPLVEDWSKKLPAFLGEGLVVTLSATFFTLPITLFNFQAFSVISPLANVLFLPLIPLIMFSSFISLVADMLLPGMGNVLGSITWLGSTLLIEGVHLCAKIPFALVEVGEFGVVLFCLYYFILTMLIRFVRKSRLDKIYCQRD